MTEKISLRFDCRQSRRWRMMTICHRHTRKSTGKHQHQGDPRGINTGCEGYLMLFSLGLMLTDNGIHINRSTIRSWTVCVDTETPGRFQLHRKINGRSRSAMIFQKIWELKITIDWMMKMVDFRQFSTTIKDVKLSAASPPPFHENPTFEKWILIRLDVESIKGESGSQ